MNPEIKAKVVLKKDREASVKRLHPWIFSGAIETLSGEVADGDWVEVVCHKKKVLGFGHYQRGSIAVRIICFGEAPPPETLWTDKLSSAHTLRMKSGVFDKTNAYRLVHGEGDGLPGLVIDVYNGVAVIQAHSIGMYNDRANIASAIRRTLSAEVTSIYYKSMNAMTSEYLWGISPVPHCIHEHGQKFEVDWEEGQKTGFFLDQRENRKLLMSYCKGQRVLNTFCYTGGFSVYALAGGAELVHSVDASGRAIELCRKNIELNNFSVVDNPCFQEDVFKFLENKEKFDVIILDPPAFAKHKEARHQAMKGYQRLNAEAMKCIDKEGILFTFSCSQVVDRQLFYDTLVSAAIQAGREIKVLHFMSQPPDHPVSIFHPEGEYLKGFVLYVC